MMHADDRTMRYVTDARVASIAEAMRASRRPLLVTRWLGAVLIVLGTWLRREDVTSVMATPLPAR